MTATLPYIVLAIFFGRAVTLKGSLDGIIHMFKPQVIKDVARNIRLVVKNSLGNQPFCLNYLDFISKVQD